MGQGSEWHLLVCVSVRSLKGKQLELSAPNLEYIYSVAVARHALTQSSKGQGHGYENRHGRMVASEVCCCGRVLLLLLAWDEHFV